MRKCTNISASNREAATKRNVVHLEIVDLTLMEQKIRNLNKYSGFFMSVFQNGRRTLSALNLAKFIDQKRKTPDNVDVIRGLA